MPAIAKISTEEVIAAERRLIARHGLEALLTCPQETGPADVGVLQ